MSAALKAAIDKIRPHAVAGGPNSPMWDLIYSGESILRPDTEGAKPVTHTANEIISLAAQL